MATNESTNRQRVAILGGGVAGLAAAWRLSEPGWGERFESITVYERSWRLGGKAASSRGPNGRIEEHGLHVWLGYYENAFRLVREVYGELDREARRPGAPIRTWTDAFKPANQIGLEDRGDDRWKHWVATFSLNDEVPGEPDAPAGPMSVLEFVRRSLRLLADFYRSLEDRVQGRVTISSNPTPPEEGGVGLEGAVATALMASALAAGMQIVRVARNEQQLLGNYLPGLERLGQALNGLHRRLRQLVVKDDAARRLLALADLILTTVRGIVTDGLLTDPRGFSAINDEEYRQWIARHGASPETLDSPLVRGVYDLVFGYQDGDSKRPRFAAGLGLFLSGKLFFEYRGSIFWKLAGGMGDVLFAPLYEALTERGVRFEFFSRVEALHPVGGSIGSVQISRLRQLASGPASYRPLIEINGLPCFPSSPEPDGDVDPRYEYESVWSRAADQVIVLEKGRDFDQIVFAIPVGMIPYVCGEIIKENRQWRTMVDHLGTVATQAFQLWLTATPSELGWTKPGVTMTGFRRPFETWSAMDHLLAVEQWPRPDPPHTLAYFCSTLATDGLPDREDLDFPKREHERVREHAVAYLRESARHFWPGAVAPDTGSFRWDLLAGAGDRVGEDRFDSQYWRANVDPSERYVLSLPGSDRYRLRADHSGYDNLVLAGDWIDSGLNAGCLEAAVMAGLQAANVLTGQPLTSRIAGYYMDWGK
ncbi:MAG: FAD-dependent oxidoreductase [Acidimicrobiia bacterium]